MRPIIAISCTSIMFAGFFACSIQEDHAPPEAASDTAQSLVMHSNLTVQRIGLIASDGTGMNANFVKESDGENKFKDSSIYALFDNFRGPEKLYFEGSDTFGQTTASIRQRIKGGICNLWNENRVDAIVLFGYSRGSITNLTALAELWNLGGVEPNKMGCLEYGISKRPDSENQNVRKFPVVVFTGHLDAVSTMMEPKEEISLKYWTSSRAFSSNCFHLKKQDDIGSEFERQILSTQKIEGCNDVKTLPDLRHTGFARSDVSLRLMAQAAEQKLGLKGILFASELELKVSDPRKPVNTFCFEPGSRNKGTIRLPRCPE